MTFSILGRDGKTGMLGVAITTSSIAVASRCPWARSGVGAIATQNITDPGIGPRGLDLMTAGLNAADALKRVLETSKYTEYRQITMIDRSGRTAAHTGLKTLGTNNVAPGRDCIAAGNLLANPDVPVAMTRTFEADVGTTLPERLLRALEEGLVAGGEMGPLHSAGLLVVRDQPWPLADLRIDWHDEAPLEALRRLWEAYEPQMEAYQTRAVNPATAPAYGVPGDP